MYPDLFKVGSITIHSYGVMLMISFIVGMWLCVRRAPRWGLTKDNVVDSAMWALVLGVLGARALYIALDWGYYAEHRNELFQWQFNGLTSFGGVLGGLLGLMIGMWRAKKSPLQMLDVAGAAFLLAHPIGRIGCLLNGCCYGGQCDLPWGIHVGSLPGLFHPAQVYDGLLNLVALAVLLLIERRHLKLGQSFGFFLILHGLTRVIYEFWRAGTSSTYFHGLPITDAQLAALIFMVVGAVIVVIRGRGQLVEPVSA